MAYLSTSPPRKYGAVDDSVHPPHINSISQADPNAHPATFIEVPPVFEEDVARGQWKRWMALGLVGGFAVGAITAVAHAGSRVPKVAKTSDPGFAELGEIVKPGVTHSSGSSPLLTPLSFTALNFYHVRDGKPGQDYPWLRDIKLIEPHRETTLAATNAQEGFEYRWEVRGGSDMALQATGSGPECAVTLTTLEVHIVTLEEINTNGVVTRRIEERVMVKYVRREVRTLTDGEREELLDAMHQLWAVKVGDDSSAKEMYGNDYADIYAINRLHYKAASPIECDHFHDGLGFLTNHALISNTFEFSLQRVNPKLTLPYWDFTIESSSSAGAAGDSTKQSDAISPIFDPSWFGTYDARDNMVKDGRWAYTEIPRMVKNNPGRIDPDVYSKLRAPWNVNDRPYLTRGMGMMCGVSVDESYPWPTCDTHFDLVTAYNDFYSWVWFSPYDPHGAVHVWIGGVLDCEQTYNQIAALVGHSTAEKLALLAFVHRKNMYRDGMFKCEGSAQVNQSPEEVLSTGVCGCLDYDLTQGDDYETVYKTILMLDDLIGDATANTKRKVVAALCTTPMNDGDHLQASSSLDPSFWSTHPTMERLWMYSVLTGQITDYTWPDSDVNYTDSDGVEVTETLSLYPESCEGHRGSDVFPFGLLDTDTDGFEIKTAILANGGTGNTLTNREALQAFDPRANGLTYIYDTFKWDHCATDGVDFDRAWDVQLGTSASAPRPTFEKGAPRAPRYKSILNQRKMKSLKKAGQE